MVKLDIMASMQRKWKSGTLLEFLCWSPTASRAISHHSPHPILLGCTAKMPPLSLNSSHALGFQSSPAPFDHAHQDPKPEESQRCWQICKLWAQRHDPASHVWDILGASFTCISISLQWSKDRKLQKHKLPFSLGSSAPMQLRQ